jgi:hypothetical protein
METCPTCGAPAERNYPMGIGNPQDGYTYQSPDSKEEDIDTLWREVIQITEKNQFMSTKNFNPPLMEQEVRGIEGGKIKEYDKERRIAPRK